MMKVKLLAGVAMAGLFAAGVANAEPNGWYGAIDAGYHTIGTIEADGQRGPQFNIEAQDDWAAFARLGYRFDQNWRVELEGGYRSNDIESIDNPVAGNPTGICAVGPDESAGMDGGGPAPGGKCVARGRRILAPTGRRRWLYGRDCTRAWPQTQSLSLHLPPDEAHPRRQRAEDVDEDDRGLED